VGPLREFAIKPTLEVICVPARQTSECVALNFIAPHRSQSLFVAVTKQSSPARQPHAEGGIPYGDVWVGQWLLVQTGRTPGGITGAIGFVIQGAILVNVLNSIWVVLASTLAASRMRRRARESSPGLPADARRGSGAEGGPGTAPPRSAGPASSLAVPGPGLAPWPRPPPAPCCSELTMVPELGRGGSPECRSGSRRGPGTGSRTARCGRGCTSSRRE
jgi:hypothetical protein